MERPSRRGEYRRVNLERVLWYVVPKNCQPNPAGPFVLRTAMARRYVTSSRDAARKDIGSLGSARRVLLPARCSRRSATFCIRSHLVNTSSPRPGADPLGERPLGAKVFLVDSEPSIHRPASHLDEATPRCGDDLVDESPLEADVMRVVRAGKARLSVRRRLRI